MISPRFDLAVFAGPAVVALALVPFGRFFAEELPLPMWVIAVLLVDVAHVHATWFVTYLDREARRRHRIWLLGVPPMAFVAGAAVASASIPLFWTLLAYVAVFHFMRQQVGWVALYQRAETDLGRFERFFERFLVYSATGVPVLWWHAHLPRAYHWFLPGDFVEGIVAASVANFALAIYLALLALWLARTTGKLIAGRPMSLGKVVVISTTAATWGVGIIATNSDWAFTLTNVLVHGVPYTAYVYARSRRVFGLRVGLPLYAGALVALAYGEEWLWDRAIWRENTVLFPGPEWLGDDMTPWLLGLLVVPQLSHYVIDGVIWRRRRPRTC
ncbi:MAG: hypothetical protein HC923_08785 [Myxococcales bacterium]|nr:hypothetical protein [Myxococcales bacterium]